MRKPPAITLILLLPSLALAACGLDRGATTSYVPPNPLQAGGGGGGGGGAGGGGAGGM
jgi:hypothetical protein